MFHSDLNLEIRYLQAQLDFKRSKLSGQLKNAVEFGKLEKLFVEIKELEQKLQVCFEEANSQFEN